MSLSGLNANQMQAAGASLGNLNPETVGNREDVELQWAMKAYQHAETYENLLRSVDPKFLKLTKIDDEIYQTFRLTFPNFSVAKLEEAEMQEPESKQRWRDYCNMFDQRVEDFNMGTLIRVDSSKEFSEENSTLVVRIQFLAIEIARNREGCNAGLKVTDAKKDVKASS